MHVGVAFIATVVVVIVVVVSILPVLAVLLNLVRLLVVFLFCLILFDFDQHLSWLTFLHFFLLSRPSHPDFVSQGHARQNDMRGNRKELLERD